MTAPRIALLFLILSTAALADDQGSNKQAGAPLEFQLRDVPGVITIDGQHFEVPVAGTVIVTRENEKLRASVTIDADLKSLQDGLPDVVRRRVNHHDECNEVIDVHTIAISPDGSSLHVDAAAHYEHWECPWTEVFGQRISAGKHKIVEQDGSATLILMPETDGSSVSIRLEVRDMKADGILGDLLKTDILGPWLRDLILQSLPQTTRLANIAEQLPKPLRTLPIRLDSVSFQDRGSGVPGLRVKATIDVSGTIANDAWQHLHEERK